MKNENDYKKDNKIGLIFDIDGTILDNMHISFELIGDLAEKYSITLDEKFHNTLSDEVNEILHNVGSKNAGLKAFYHVAKRLKIPFYRRIRFLILTQKLAQEKVQNSSFIKGAIDTLNLFYNNERFLIGALTNASKHEVKGRFVGKEKYFELLNNYLIAGDDVNTTKPDPEGIKKLSLLMEIPPERIIMIGDTTRDILTGKNFGAITIGVLSGYIPKKDFESVDADFIFKDISEIPKNIEKILLKIHQ